ncbi:hypothetical protein B0H19DRAFT_1185801 [Mycena capillaripes]|nr:hypothetical protein B0H19DRAFT_1185801 [Mycena capillaripes]
MSRREMKRPTNIGMLLRWLRAIIVGLTQFWCILPARASRKATYSPPSHFTYDCHTPLASTIASPSRLWTPQMRPLLRPPCTTPEHPRAMRRVPTHPLHAAPDVLCACHVAVNALHIRINALRARPCASLIRPRSLRRLICIADAARAASSHPIPFFPLAVGAKTRLGDNVRRSLLRSIQDVQSVCTLDVSRSEVPRASSRFRSAAHHVLSRDVPWTSSLRLGLPFITLLVTRC